MNELIEYIKSERITGNLDEYEKGFNLALSKVLGKIKELNLTK